MSAAAPAPRPRIREAGERDLDRLLALYERLAEHHAPAGSRFALEGAGDERLRAHLRGRVADPDAALVLADEGGDLLGFCLAVRTTRPAFFAEVERIEVEGLFVRDDRRRQGLARALFEAALAAADPAGRLRVELAVARDNPEGEGFWKALGFAPVMDVLERRR